MWWCFGIAATVILIFFVLAAADEDGDGGSRSSKRPRGASKRAEEMAAKVDSLAKYRALERRLENTDWDSSRYDLLEEAVGIASDKVLAWQFIPDVGPTTPLNVLKRAYKVYSLAKVDEAKAELGHDIWYELRGDDEPEPPEEEFDFFLQFRKAVESRATQRTKIKKINELCASRPDIAEEWLLDPKSKFTPGDQWFADALKDAGLPLAHELYAEGYTTPEKCLEIDLKEFRARKGVGPKTAEALREYQATVRKSIEQLTETANRGEPE